MVDGRVGRVGEIVMDTILLVNKIRRLERAIKELEFFELSSVASSRDDDGVYKTVEWTRADDTLYARSTLLGSPPYPSVEIEYFDTDGTSVIKKITWDLTYDDDDFVYKREVV